MARIFFLFSILSLCLFKAMGQEKDIWLHGKDISKKGFYKNLGFTQKPYSLGLVIQNSLQIEQTQYLKINNPHTNNLLLIDTSGDTLYNTGDHKIFSSRPVFFWDFVLPITVKANTTDSFRLILDNAGESQVFNIQLMSQNRFEKIKTGDTFMYGTILAFSFIFSAIFLLLGIFKKDKTNIIFSAFILFSTFWLYNINGILYQILWPNNVFMQHSARIICSTTSIGSFVYYFITFHKNRIGKKALIVFKSFIAVLIMRIVFVVGMPELLLNVTLKYFLLIFGTLLIIIGLILLIFYLIKLFTTKNQLIHNIGFGFYFIYVLKEGVKLGGIDMFPFPAYDEYISAGTLFTITAIFSIANIQHYLLQKKQQYLNELEASHKRDQEMTEKIIDAQEHERSSIGKDIHDQVGVLLSVIKVKLQTIKKKRADGALNEEMDQLVHIINNCNEELHNIVDNLVPPAFEQNSFVEIIKNRIEIFEKATEIEFHLTTSFEDIEDEVISLVLYRVVSELIANSIKHAECSDIFIDMNETNNSYVLKYSDNGIGMEDMQLSQSHGIKNIHSRIKYLNGTLTSTSEPGRTEYRIEIPIHK